MAVGHVAGHLGVACGARPCLVEDVLKGELLHVEAFECGAYALEVASALAQGLLQALACLLDVAVQHGVAAEVAQVAPYVGLAVELIVHAPHLGALGKVVEHGHLALGHAGEHGPGALGGEVFALVVEKPPHLQPLSLLVDGLERLVDVPRHLVEVAGLEAGRRHLVEEVDAIDVVGAEEARLLLQKHLLDFGIERVLAVEEVGAVLVGKAVPLAQVLDVGIGVQCLELARHVACKGGKHGAHAQCALARQYELLQGCLALEPLLGQGSAPAVDVRHAVPGQVDGACEIAAHLLIGHAQTGPHVVPHAFLAGDGQRHVDTVEGHPVDEALPVFPLPEGHRVAEGAVVQKKSLWHAGCRGVGHCNVGQRGGQLDGHVGIPRHGGEAVFLEIVVEPHGHRVGIVAGDDDLAVFALDAEGVVVAVEQQLPEHHFAGQSRRQAPGQCLGLLHVAACLCGRGCND